jgi:hypothetical protein
MSRSVSGKILYIDIISQLADKLKLYNHLNCVLWQKYVIADIQSETKFVQKLSIV